MRILSLDGGGICGLMPARILTALEAKLGSPLCHHFDLVAGTSTGGIIAAAIGAGLPMATIRDLYRDDAGKIFHTGLGSVLALDGMAGNKYSPKGLEICLYEVFGDLRLAECQTDVLITSCDLAAKPQFFMSSMAKRAMGADFYLRDVCRATSAAPTYFPPAMIISMGGGPGYILQDGGLVANQPAMSALAEAQRLASLDQVDLLLSLGTGYTPVSRKPTGAQGALAEGATLLNLIFTGPGHAVDWEAQALLGDRYVRVQPELDDIPMDTTKDSDLAKLEAAADAFTATRTFEHIAAMLGQTPGQSQAA
jgi:hypothetical protein